MTGGARLAAWAELLRVSALFTVPGDAVAGAASIGVRPNRGTALAVGASLCLYEAGMALNDWADRAEDAVDRPHRPIPSGRITPRAALAASAALTVTGLALAAGAGRRALGTATALAATIWAYDLHLKHTPAAPAAMATARALDLLLGATATATRSAADRAELFSPHPAPSRPHGQAPGPPDALWACPQSPDGLDTTPPGLTLRTDHASQAEPDLAAAPGYPVAPGRSAAPGFAAEPSRPAAPGYPAASGLAAAPGYPAAPGFAVESGGSAAPGRAAGPGRLAAPGLAAESGRPAPPSNLAPPGLAAEPRLAPRPGLPAGSDSPGAVAPFLVRPLSARPAFEDRGLGRSPSFGKGRVGEKLRRTPPGAGVRDALAAAAMLGAHTYAVTAVSRRETQGGSTAAPLAALAAAAVLATLAARQRSEGPRTATPPAWRSRTQPNPGSPAPGKLGPAGRTDTPHHNSDRPLPAATTMPEPTRAAAIRVATHLATPATLAAAAYFRTAAKPLLHAALNPSPPLTQRAVGGGIRAMIPLQAALAARSSAVGAGAALIGLVPIARKLSRKVSPT